MKKICYLHIGMPKTGTTSIQENFYAKRKEIERDTGIFYYREHINGKDDPENIIRTISLALRYKNPKIKLHAFDYLGLKIDPADDKKHYDNLIYILKNKNKIFLSAEGFCGQHKDFFIGLQNIINEYGFDIKTLLYVRNPYDFISSVTQQSLKTGLGLIDKFYFYESLKNSVDFWGNNLELRRFEQQYLMKQDLFYDICAWLEEPLIFDLLDKQNKNDSISIETCIIANIMFKNNIRSQKDDHQTHDHHLSTIFRRISNATQSKNKFLYPKSIYKSNRTLRDEIEDYRLILREYFNDNNLYSDQKLGNYDINKLSSIDEHVMINTIYNLAKNNHHHKNVKYIDIIKALFSKKRRKRLGKIS